MPAFGWAGEKYIKENYNYILIYVTDWNLSWKYDSQKGIIYSNKAKLNYLKEYSLHYNTVEIDQFFWSLFDGSPLKMPEQHVIEKLF